jgi:hypothetical protein
MTAAPRKMAKNRPHAMLCVMCGQRYSKQAAQYARLGERIVV